MTEPDINDPRRAWTWRHAIARSTLPAETRHVLLTLSLCMNELGGGCYPSVADLVSLTGRDKKTVLKHLALAEDAGWIAVSQHGYRGQKWKRNEYVACWPGRDVQPDPLDAEEGSDETEKRGGATPPPSPEAVETVPEGGGTGSRKVVEHVHQDKILPETFPEKLPVEREARAREEDDPKKVEAAFWRLVQDWPDFAPMPKQPALKAWLDLSADDRAEAARKFPGWLAALKAAKKSHVPAPSTYFRERLWTSVAEADEPKPQPDMAKPGGKAWMARRLSLLIAGRQTSAAIPALTVTQRRLVEAGQADEAEMLRDNVARYGFPAVNTMHDRAAIGQGAVVPAECVTLGADFVQVRIGSEWFEAWREEHRLRGWPWLPSMGRAEWVYFPAGTPADALTAFAAAINAGDGKAAPEQPEPERRDDA